MSHDAAQKLAARMKLAMAAQSTNNSSTPGAKRPREQSDEFGSRGAQLLATGEHVHASAPLPVPSIVRGAQRVVDSSVVTTTGPSPKLGPEVPADGCSFMFPFEQVGNLDKTTKPELVKLVVLMGGTSEADASTLSLPQLRCIIYRKRGVVRSFVPKEVSRGGPASWYISDEQEDAQPEAEPVESADSLAAMETPGAQAHPSSSHTEGETPSPALSS